MYYSNEAQAGLITNKSLLPIGKMYVFFVQYINNAIYIIHTAHCICFGKVTPLSRADM